MTTRAVYKFSTLVLVTLGVATSVSFAKKKAKKPPKSTQQEIVVAYHKNRGKITFRVLADSKAKKYTLTANAEGKTVERVQLAKKDFEFVRKQVSAIKEKSNNLRLCKGDYVEIRSGKRSIVGCMKSPSKVAEKTRKIANLLAAASRY